MAKIVEQALNGTTSFAVTNALTMFIVTVEFRQTFEDWLCFRTEQTRERILEIGA